MRRQQTPDELPLGRSLGGDRETAPGVSRMLRQAQARKNHSYFLVFIKPQGRRRWTGIDPDLRFATDGAGVAGDQVAGRDPNSNGKFE